MDATESVTWVVSATNLRQQPTHVEPHKAVAPPTRTAAHKWQLFGCAQPTPAVDYVSSESGSAPGPL